MSSAGREPSSGFDDISESSLVAHTQDQHYTDAESESDDPVVNHGNSDDLLLSDPLSSAFNDQDISFKRKHKTPSSETSGPFNFLSRFSRFSARRSPSQTPRGRNGNSLQSTPNNESRDDGSATDETKEGSQMDWYVEGPGRRVGYEDMTAIDWIFEYSKERQRLRVLHSNARGIIGYIQELIDWGQIWLILIATGVAVGVLAAGIDITTSWLSDLKTGYCKSGIGGGKFYLSRGFCCWGHDQYSQCKDWTPWGRALHAKSSGSEYFVQYAVYMVLSVFFAACSAILVKHYAVYARHSGIPEIKTVLGGFVIRHFMGTWTLIIKSLGLCLSVASGLWLGKEGPLVHVACCCANLFMKLSDTLNHNEARKREVLSAASAAGISVAFGSPIGGVLFSLEQLSYYFPDKTMWQSFVCAMVAAVSLQALNPFRTGKIVLFQVTYSSGWHAFELAPFLLLGVIGGLYGGLFIKLNMFVARFRKTRLHGRFPVVEVIVIALITSIVNYPNLFLRSNTSELVYALFAECKMMPGDILHVCLPSSTTTTVTVLLLAAVSAFVFASVTFGLQLPAGIILPSMAIGALYGRALGILVQNVQLSIPSSIFFSSCEPDIPCVTPGTYAIIGAASALAGVTRMTVSIVVIMFELTGALTYVLPIMIAVMVAKWIGDFLSPHHHGIYEAWIEFNEYPFLPPDTDAVIPDLPISHLYTPISSLVALPAIGHTISSLRNLITKYPYRGFPCILSASNPILVGYISRTELLFALSTPSARSLPPSTPAYFANPPTSSRSLDLRAWMDQTPITLSGKSSLQLTVSMFQKLGLRYVMFVDRGRLKGLLTKKDIWMILERKSTGAEGYGGRARRESSDRRDVSEERGLLSMDANGSGNRMEAEANEDE